MTRKCRRRFMRSINGMTEPEPRKARRTSKRGRPIAAARVHAAIYDELYALARVLRVDVSALVREAIDQRLERERSGVNIARQ